MLELKLEVEKKQSWFWTRNSLEIEAVFSSNEEIFFSSFADKLFSIHPELIPSESFYKRHLLIHDLRGRPYETFPQSERETIRHNEEELFYVQGLLYDVESVDLGESHNSPSLPALPFTFSILTQFESFEIGAHIAHRIEHGGDPLFDEVFSDLSACFFSRLFPAKLQKMRLGLEAYYPKVTGALFGVVPNIRDRFYLELSPGRISLLTSSEGRGRQLNLPFGEQKLLNGFSEALRTSGLFDNFIGALQAKV